MEYTDIQFIPCVGIEKVEVVNLDTAKFLKENGFNIPTHFYWQDISLPFVERGLKRVKYGKRRMNHNRYDEWIYSAPTKEQLLKWKKLKSL
jgi:hypothetical protein